MISKEMRTQLKIVENLVDDLELMNNDNRYIINHYIVKINAMYNRYVSYNFMQNDEKSIYGNLQTVKAYVLCIIHETYSEELYNHSIHIINVINEIADPY